MQDGYKPGDPLCCAYQGEVDYSLSAVTGSNINIVLDFLWGMFNTDNRPADYLGPSMSVGSIITLSGVAFAVKPFGFEQVDISSSPRLTVILAG